MEGPTNSDDHRGKDIAVDDSPNIMNDDDALPETNKQAEEKAILDYIAKETAFINKWRLLIVFVVFLVATSVTVAVWYFQNEQEKDSFESAFNEAASTLISSIKSETDSVEAAFSQLSDTVTSVALEKNASFPFVTLSNYEIHATYVREATGATFIWTYMNVSPAQREEWDRYSVEASSLWIPEGLSAFGGSDFNETIVPGLYFYNTSLPEKYDFKNIGPGPWTVVHQLSPVESVPFSSINSIKNFDEEFLRRKKPVDELKSPLTTDTYQSHRAGADSFTSSPRYQVYAPIFNGFSKANRVIVGYIVAILVWRDYFEGALAKGVDGIYVVLKNSCEQVYTWEVFGPEVVFKGPGDFHDRSWDYLEQKTIIGRFEDRKVAEEAGACTYELFFYPSNVFREDNEDPLSLVFTILVAFIFVGMITTFIVYDSAVQKRNAKIVSNAARSNEFLSSLFPSNVRDRILGAQGGDPLDERTSSKLSEHKRLGNFMEVRNTVQFSGDPIADLFSETTVMFADLAGFTAWSSARQPVNVFQLLETLFSSFDDAARKLKVFKVETIGDCYVAVAGLPEPRIDHAVVMARFASECLSETALITSRLERTLGPDTGDLALRVGMHSGPVTAGVLRGDRARFQLFGDTVNTASRMESTGKPGKIQVTKETAELLTSANKGSWLMRREDMVHAKGKGELVTYWLTVQKAGSVAAAESSTQSSIDSGMMLGSVQDIEQHDRNGRLVEWNVEILRLLILQVIARRQASSDNHGPLVLGKDNQLKDTSPLDELSDTIELPGLNEKIACADESSIELDSRAERQLKEYVVAVASMHSSLPYHNFEHASNVVMNVKKLLQRVVSPSNLTSDLAPNEVALAMHNHSFGIASDPLTQLGCIMSAMIHNVSHPGVSNSQLVKETAALAARYNGKSVAEQNALDIAWGLLMDDQYEDLRRCIMATTEEVKRFRRVVVNSVIATDILDYDLNRNRAARWEAAFQNDRPDEVSTGLKAAVIIEYIVQASAVSHTMQHWQIFLKWNKKLFKEMHSAFQSGRTAGNPADFWYEGEIKFFDSFVIPLAEKLQKCGGVFGVTGDECLTYALQNRREWESKGAAIVADMVKEVEAEPALRASVQK